MPPAEHRQHKARPIGRAVTHNAETDTGHTGKSRPPATMERSAKAVAPASAGDWHRIFHRRVQRYRNSLGSAQRIHPGAGRTQCWVESSWRFAKLSVRGRSYGPVGRRTVPTFTAQVLSARSREPRLYLAWASPSWALRTLVEVGLLGDIRDHRPHNSYGVTSLFRRPSDRAAKDSPSKRKRPPGLPSPEDCSPSPLRLSFTPVPDCVAGRIVGRLLGPTETQRRAPGGLRCAIP